MSTKHPKQQLRKQVVIIEIGSEWLKIAQFDKGVGGLVLAKLHLEKFETVGADLTRMIVDAYKQHKFTRIPVIACLPRKVVNVRMLDLPSSEMSEIEDMVELQINKLTPYSKTEILSDYVVTGTNRSGYARVMLTIVQRAILRQRYAAIEAAGLQIEKMTLSTEGLQNWGTFNAEDLAGNTILLDIDSVNSELVIVSDGKLAFTRGIMMGADALKNNFEQNKELFLRDINRSIDMMHGESVGVVPDHMILVGANVGPLSEYLNENLDIPVKTVNCMENIKSRPEVPDISGEKYGSVSLTAVIGCALSPDTLQFNLVPDVVKLRKEMIRRARNLTWFVMLVLTVMVSFSFFFLTEVSLVTARHKSLQQQYQSTLPETENVEKMLDLIKVVNDRKNPEYAFITIINHLHDQVKGDLIFYMLDMDRETGKIILNGSAGQSRDIRMLVTSLEKSPYFENVKETGATIMDRKTKRYKFEISFMLEKTK